MSIYHIEAETIIATSPGIDSGITVGEGEDLGRYDNTANHPSPPQPMGADMVTTLHPWHPHETIHHSNK